MHRLAGFERDRDKLLGQKELLVKKLKALMKEAEQ
jgi:hypothetical protein